jgi:hypothetical protein
MRELKEEIKEAAARKYLDEEIAAARDLSEVTSSKSRRGSQKDTSETETKEAKAQEDTPKVQVQEDSLQTEVRGDTSETEVKKPASKTEVHKDAPQPEAQEAPVPCLTPAPDVKQAIPPTEPRETAPATQEGKKVKEAKDKSLESVLEEMKKEARS